MANRESNFKIDNDIYGKHGENVFREWCLSNRLYCIDESDEFVFQICDVDFLITDGEIVNDEKGNPLLTLPNNAIEILRDKKSLRDIIMSHDMDRRDFNYNGIVIRKIEVKTDTVTITSRNIVYEVISHDSAGCMAETKADYIFYVCVDDTNIDTIGIINKEIWLIDMYKWRKFLRECFFGNMGIPNTIDIKTGRYKASLRGNNFSPDKDKVANVLCDIDYMASIGIAQLLFKDGNYNMNWRNEMNTMASSAQRAINGLPK